MNCVEGALGPVLLAQGPQQHVQQQPTILAGPASESSSATSQNGQAQEPLIAGQSCRFLPVWTWLPSLVGGAAPSHLQSFAAFAPATQKLVLCRVHYWNKRWGA
jgi:hypothetical protein